MPVGQHCCPGVGFQEAEVLKGEALGGLGVHGREKDAELVTAAAVGGGERSRRKRRRKRRW